MPTSASWRGIRVIVTGHSGFKGYWLTSWLTLLGAEVLGISLKDSPPTNLRALGGPIGGEIFADIREDTWVRRALKFDPQVIFHLAAQPLVLPGYEHPHMTFETNVMGTANILDFSTQLPDLAALVVITTDKVYAPDSPQPYSEISPLGGRDPYSASKAATELLVQAWPSPNSHIGTARAGNVIGGGDFAKFRLVPDLVQAWTQGKPARIRNPLSTRPWQHVLEPVRGYIMYAEALMHPTKHSPHALNFGPSSDQVVPVQQVVDAAMNVWGDMSGAKCTFTLESPGENVLEATTLALDSSLAQSTLGWSNLLNWRYALSMTLSWYHRHNQGTSVEALIRDQIDEYSAAAG